MRSIFEDETTEGVFLIDAQNAFNSLNRVATLHSVQVLCPSIAPALININFIEQFRTESTEESS